MGCGYGSFLFFLGVVSRLEYLKMGFFGGGVGGGNEFFIIVRVLGEVGWLNDR